MACTGHGICAQLLPDDFVLDEWGYPIVRRADISDKDAAIAVKLCPARALYRA
ncbi:MAG: ferredoxin [Nostocoides sp.]